MTNPAVFDLSEFNLLPTEQYKNEIVAATNDHVTRISIMTESFYWHRHPNSDETFLVLEGELWIDFSDGSVLLKPGQGYTVKASRVHRTRPANGRSVNISFEKAEIITERAEGKE